MNKPHPQELADAINAYNSKLEAYTKWEYNGIIDTVLFKSGVGLLIEIHSTYVKPTMTYIDGRRKKLFKYKDYPAINDLVGPLMEYISVSCNQYNKLGMRFPGF